MLQNIRFSDHGFGMLPPGSAIGPARWDCHDLLCVHRGVVTLEVSERRVVLTAGEGVLIYPGTRFAGQADGGKARISVQHFYLSPRGRLPRTLARLRGRTGGYERMRFLDLRGLERDIERAIELAFAAPSDDLHDLRAAQLILIVGQMYLHGKTAGVKAVDPRAVQLQQWLSRQLPRCPDVGAMAEHVDMSESHFRVWFRQQFGLSPQQFLIRARLEEAMRLLRESRAPVKQIAAQLGYSDATNLYRDFRRVLSTTPAIYRARHTING